MTFKTGVLAAAAALSLAIPAVALAQPHGDPNFAGSYHPIPDREPAPDYDRGPGYGYPPPAPAYRTVYDGDRWDRFEARRREWLRFERMQRLRWDCEHGYGCRNPGYRW